MNHQRSSLAIVVGGHITDQLRLAIQAGDEPRIDVVEMENRFPATLYDFSWLERCAKTERLTGLLYQLLVQRLGRMSELLALRVLVESFKHHAIYVTGEDVGIPLAILLNICFLRKPRIVMRLETLHYGSTPVRRFLYRLYTRFAANRINQFVCRTPAYKEFLHTSLGVDADRLTFLPEPIDLDFFDRSLANKAPEPSVPEGPFILSAGLELRDYATLIKAVEQLPVQVIIAAGSPWSHRSFGNSQANGAKNVQVKRFNRAEMRQLYSHASTVVVPVHPTLRACGMNVINEAWAMHCPIVATETEGLATQIDNGQTGLLVPPYDVLSLRKAIELVINRDIDVKRLTHSAYCKAVENASLEKYVTTIYAFLLNEATNRHGQPESAPNCRKSIE